MLRCSIIIRSYAPIYRSIDAGHSARQEMENSDENDDPCRFDGPEPGGV
jgi:hypothetical protein